MTNCIKRINPRYGGNNKNNMVQFDDNPDRKNIVELRNIKQSYDGGKNWIIENLDLVIEDKPDQGQFVVILGMSGSG